MSEREDLAARIEVVLRQMSMDLEGWRRDGLARNSTLRAARELLEEAQWEGQTDLAGRLASGIQEFEDEVEHGRPG
ncbi:MAG: hypothetical protein ACRDOK_04320 [Streptosporangiaceae bacterium]